MFFGLRYVTSHPLYKLQDAVECFFKHSITANTFSIDCFPKWFRPVVTNSWRLRKRFEKIAELLQQQTVERRQHVYNVFKNNNKIKKLCSDPLCTLETLDAGLIDLNKE